MVKKVFITIFATIILCLCCDFCFAAESDNSSINLGNEIMESIDKTETSVDDIVSGNIIRDDTNGDGSNDTDVTSDDSKNDLRDGKNEVDSVVNRTETGSSGAYNVTRTTTEGTTNVSTMSTTTWMWIILVVAAIIIIAAIWYYSTQNNE